MIKIPREFYYRDTITVAQDLLGQYLVHHNNGQEQIGKIVEVEAYLGREDRASHSFKGITNRTKVMFGPPGFAYVYLIYGIHYCMNIVTEPEGIGSAVLIRAIEPIQNIHSRTQGPGLLTRAMSITTHLNGYDLTSKNFYLATPNDREKISIISKPRIGIEYAQEWKDKLLRFYIKDNAFISKR